MLQKLFGNFEQNDKTDVVSAEDASAAEEKRSKRAKLLDELRSGMHENDIIEVDVAETNQGSDSMLAMGIDINLGEMFGGMLPRKTKNVRSPFPRVDEFLFLRRAISLLIWMKLSVRQLTKQSRAELFLSTR